MHIQIDTSTPYQQQGAVLIMSLILLFVLTLIGVSSMNTTVLEEKMAGNTRNRHFAFTAAENVLRDAESYVNNSATLATVTAFNNTNGLYKVNQGPSGTNAFDAATWWTTAGDFINYSGSMGEINTPPKFAVEYRYQIKFETPEINPGYGGGGKTPIDVFRITARGTGLTNNSVVIIQSYFGRRFN